MLTANDLAKAFAELNAESSDRAIAIVGGALIEDATEDAIVSRLLPMSKAHRDALFHSDSGYTFAAKIDLGLSLGLYGNRAKLDMHRIKKIRNEFAHNIDRDFSHELIIKSCREITNYDTTTEPMSADLIQGIGSLRKTVEGREWRWRFLFAITHITVGLVKAAADSVPPPLSEQLKD